MKTWAIRPHERSHLWGKLDNMALEQMLLSSYTSKLNRSVENGRYIFGTSFHNKHKPGKEEAVSQVITCCPNNIQLSLRVTTESSLLAGSQSSCPASNQKVLGGGVKFVSSLKYSYVLIKPFLTPKRSIRDLRI